MNSLDVNYDDGPRLDAWWASLSTELKSDIEETYLEEMRKYNDE